MKKIALMFTMSLFISFSAQANDKKKKESDVSKKRVLIVSFITNNFYSTYDKSEVAKTNKVTEDKVLTMLDEKVSSMFANSHEEGVEFVNHTSASDDLSEKISFSYNEKEWLIPDLEGLTNDEFNRLLTDNNVDYVIFINNYEMKWLGDPQYKLNNEIHYSIFKKDKEAIIEGKYSFSTPKLIPVAKMDKKYKKAVSKICNKFLKSSKS